MEFRVISDVQQCLDDFYNSPYYRSLSERPEERQLKWPFSWPPSASLFRAADEQEIRAIQTQVDQVVRIIQEEGIITGRSNDRHTVNAVMVAQPDKAERGASWTVGGTMVLRVVGVTSHEFVHILQRWYYRYFRTFYLEKWGLLPVHWGLLENKADMVEYPDYAYAVTEAFAVPVNDKWVVPISTRHGFRPNLVEAAPLSSRAPDEYTWTIDESHHPNEMAANWIADRVERDNAGSQNPFSGHTTPCNNRPGGCRPTEGTARTKGP